jgi:predicted phosphodiesterase
MRIAAIGDLHVNESMTQPYRALFSDMSEAADFILLCGDLTNYGKSSEAEVLASDIAAATVPVIARFSAITTTAAGPTW